MMQFALYEDNNIIGATYELKKAKLWVNEKPEKRKFVSVNKIINKMILDMRNSEWSLYR